MSIISKSSSTVNKIGSNVSVANAIPQYCITVDSINGTSASYDFSKAAKGNVNIYDSDVTAASRGYGRIDVKSGISSICNKSEAGIHMETTSGNVTSFGIGNSMTTNSGSVSLGSTSSSYYTSENYVKTNSGTVNLICAVNNFVETNSGTVNLWSSAAIIKFLSDSSWYGGNKVTTSSGAVKVNSGYGNNITTGSGIVSTWGSDGRIYTKSGAVNVNNGFGNHITTASGNVVLRSGKNTVTSASGKITSNADSNTLTGTNIFAAGSSNSLTGLSGRKNNLSIWGSRNTIVGSNMNDTIQVHGVGNTLTGKEGADNFILQSWLPGLLANTSATITDFTVYDNLHLLGKNGKALTNVTQNAIGENWKISGTDSMTHGTVSAVLDKVHSALIQHADHHWYLNNK